MWKYNIPLENAIIARDMLFPERSGRQDILDHDGVLVCIAFNDRAGHQTKEDI